MKHKEKGFGVMSILISVLVIAIVFIFLSKKINNNEKVYENKGSAIGEAKQLKEVIENKNKELFP